MVKFPEHPIPYIHKPKAKRCPSTPPETETAVKLDRRGHKRGVNMRPRDERGWMIPTEGTKMYKAYQLLSTGNSVASIASLLGWGLNTAHQMAHRIKHPEKRKAQEYARRRKDKV